MSVLIKSLERIERWLQQHKAGFVAHSGQGLTDEQIEEETRNLPFRLPKEVYELYNWLNNSIINGLVYAFSIASLNKAVEMRDLFIEISRSTGSTWNPHWLPICFSNNFFCVITGDLEQKDTSPVIFFNQETYTQYICHTSLTAMMLTIAEAYETGAYYLNSIGYPEMDEKKFAPILRRNNPELVEEGLVKLRQVQKKLSLELMSDIMENIRWFKDPRAVEPLIDLLQVPAPGFRDSNGLAEIQQIAADILGEIADTRAVTPLILALEAGYSGTRLSAAQSLGKLGDPLAIEPLLSLLQDGVESVQHASASALLKLRAIDSLIDALRSPTACIRVAVAQALGAIKTRISRNWISELEERKVVEALSNLLEDGNSEVRRSATYALVELRSIDPLIEALRSPIVYVRVTVAQILGATRTWVARDWISKIEADSLVEALSNLMEDVDGEVREAAQMSLQQIRRDNTRFKML